MRRSSIAVLPLVLVTLIGGVVEPAAAQAPDDAWGEPVNVSRTGAASRPQIVAAPDGTIQVFWWDEFDGLMTSVSDGNIFADGAWSDPVPAHILMTVAVSEEEFILTPVEVMPTIVSDGQGFAYALWVGEADEDTGLAPLLHSQIPIGSTGWTSPDSLAESAEAFEVVQSPDGGLVLAYVRPSHTDAFPAGVYVRTTPGQGGAWSAPATIYGTIYFRHTAGETTHLRVGVGSEGAAHLTWDDPYRGWALFASSTDGGATWSEPERLGQPEDAATRPRVFALADGDVLRSWEGAGTGACTLHQQRLEESDGATQTWGAPQPVLEGLASCPHGAEAVWPRNGGLLWLWGQGSGELGLAAWDDPSARWSEPRTFAFSFDDPSVPHRIALDDLRTTLVGDTLAVAGLDPSGGDIWLISGQASTWELAFAPPSPWSLPTRISEGGVAAMSPAVALDAEGNAHVVWSQSTTVDGPGTAIAYAWWDAASGRLSRAVEIVRGRANEELARQPALAADDGGLLHLVWSGNAQGQIMYARAKLEQAGSPGGWSSPVSLPMPAPAGSRPQIVVDGAGGLVVVYAVPLNESRGIYLVRSDDDGETWTERSRVFGAQAAGWPMVDQPALAVAPDDGLHVSWIEGAVPGTWQPRAIHYSLSPDGASWSDPWKATERSAEWPRLIVSGGQIHLLYVETNGGVWHRSAPLDQAGELGGWSQPSRVPGFREVDGPFGAAADGSGAIHVVGGASDTGALLYSTWDGERWIVSDGAPLGPFVHGVLGAGVAASPEDGQLFVAFEALSDSEGESEGAAAPAILFTQRGIGSTAETSTPTPVPEQGPEPEATAPVPAEEGPAATEEPLPETPEAAPLAVSPTGLPEPTPDLAIGAGPDTTASQLPMIAGMGLGAVALLALIAAWAVWRRRRYTMRE